MELILIVIAICLVVITWPFWAALLGLAFMAGIVGIFVILVAAMLG